MKHLLRCLKAGKVNVPVLCFALFSLAFSQQSVAQFTPGGIVVLTVGGVAPARAAGTSTATPLSLQEFIPNGQNTLTGPTYTLQIDSTNDGNGLTSSGSATSEGLISRSTDGYSIVIPGYNTAAGFASVASSSTTTTPGPVLRGIGKVTADGVYTLPYKTTSFSANNARGAATDGTHFWGSGANTGIVLEGSSGAGTIVSSTVTNTRGLAIYNGQLYYTTGSGTAGIYQVGTGLPITTGTTATPVSGLASSSPYGFAFNSFSSAHKNYSTVCFIADASGGIKKYTSTGGTWTLEYVMNTTPAQGLLVDWSQADSTTGVGAIVYFTGSSSDGNALYGLVDQGPANGNGGAVSTFTLYTAPSTVAFRGLAWAPIPPTPTTTSISPTSATAGAAQFTLTVNGTNFLQNGVSYVIWTNPTTNVTTNLATTYVSATQLTATVPAALVATAGTATVGVTSTGAAAVSNTQTFTINPASAAPVLQITGTTNNGSACVGSPATPVTYTITNTGTANAAGVTVVSNNTEFVVSGLSSSTIASGGGTATYTITFTPSGVGTQSATITVSSTTSGSNSPTDALTGTGLTYTAQAVSTSAASSVLDNTATLNGNITTLGTCPATIQQGFVYAQTSLNGTPTVGGTGVTQVNSSSVASGAYSLGVSGLAATTGYSVQAFAYNGTTYTYGGVVTFTTLSNATQLTFDIEPPSTGTVGSNLTTFTVDALRADGSVDAGYSGNITLSEASNASGNNPNAIGGTLTVAAVQGVANFSFVQFSAADTYTIKASSGALTPATSSSIDVTNQVLWVSNALSSGTSPWLTATNWATNTVPNGTQVAEFGTQTIDPTSPIGINMNTATYNSVANEEGVGAIEENLNSIYDSIVIGNSSTSHAGTLIINGVTDNYTNDGVNYVNAPNVVLRNGSSYNLNLDANATTGVLPYYMDVAFANATNNNIILDSSGSINMNARILYANGPITFSGIGSGTINMNVNDTVATSGNRFYLTGPEVRFATDLSMGLVPASAVPNYFVVDGGRLSVLSAASFTLNSNRGIQIGATAGTSISTPGSGSVITYNGVIADETSPTPSSGSWAKQGKGILKLGGVSTYSGSTAINNGTIQLTASNVLPSGTAVSIGQAASTNIGSLDLNGNSQTIAGLNSVTGTNTSSTTKNTVTSSTTAATLTIAGSGTYSYGNGTASNSGIISGPLSIVFSGSGSQTFGDALTYTGTTSVTGTGSLIVIQQATVPTYTSTITSSTVTVAFGSTPSVGTYPILPGALVNGGQTFSATGLAANQSASFNFANSTVTVYLTPVISPASTTLSAITTTYGTASSAQTVAITGSNLLGNITTSAAPTGFEVSSDGSNYGSTATFVQSGGSVSGTLYIRLAKTAQVSGSYNNQTITLSSSGAANATVTTAASGNAVNQANLTIIANNITKCSGATYTFAGTEFSTIGLKNGDAVSSVSLSSAGAAASATAGDYLIVPSAAVGTGLSNYSILYQEGTMTVETLTLTITQVNPDCYGDAGSLSGSVSGGTTPYMYEVNSGLTYLAGPVVYGPSTTPLYSPVAPGNYTYSVTDAAGCMAIQPGIRVNPLTQTAVLEGVTTAPSTVQICYGNTKTINTVPIGGATPYTYSLNTNGVSGAFVTSANRYFNVPAGTYYITVKDNVGCTYNTDTISITQPAAGVSFTTSIGGQACATLGGISVTAAGGYGGYSYSNNGGSSYQKSNMFMGLAYGNYTVAVEDTNGCAATQEVVKFTPLTSSAIVAAKNPICTGATTTINTVPSGGTPPYSYSLDGLAYVPSNARYFSVDAGTHTITVKDNVSCTYGPLSITITSTSCSGLTEGGEDLQKVQPSGTTFEAHLSPNPTMASFHLQLQSSSREDVELIVTNMQGVKMYEAKGGVDNTYEFGTDFKGGMYILQILQGNTVHTVKLVKGN